MMAQQRKELTMLEAVGLTAALIAQTDGRLFVEKMGHVLKALRDVDIGLDLKHALVTGFHLWCQKCPNAVRDKALVEAKDDIFEMVGEVCSFPNDDNVVDKNNVYCGQQKWLESFLHSIAAARATDTSNRLSCDLAPTSFNCMERLLNRTNITYEEKNMSLATGSAAQSRTQIAKYLISVPLVGFCNIPNGLLVMRKMLSNETFPESLRVEAQARLLDMNNNTELCYGPSSTRSVEDWTNIFSDHQSGFSLSSPLFGNSFSPLGSPFFGKDTTDGRHKTNNKVDSNADSSLKGFSKPKAIKAEKEKTSSDKKTKNDKFPPPEASGGHLMKDNKNELTTSHTSQPGQYKRKNLVIQTVDLQPNSSILKYLAPFTPAYTPSQDEHLRSLLSDMPSIPTIDMSDPMFLHGTFPSPRMTDTFQEMKKPFFSSSSNATNVTTTTTSSSNTTSDSQMMGLNSTGENVANNGGMSSVDYDRFQRGRYKCGRCGQPKVNHNCEYAVEADLVSSSTQVQFEPLNSSQRVVTVSSRKSIMEPYHVPFTNGNVSFNNNNNNNNINNNHKDSGKNSPQSNSETDSEQMYCEETTGATKPRKRKGVGNSNGSNGLSEELVVAAAAAAAPSSNRSRRQVITPETKDSTLLYDDSTDKAVQLLHNTKQKQSRFNFNGDQAGDDETGASTPKKRTRASRQQSDSSGSGNGSGNNDVASGKQSNNGGAPEKFSEEEEIIINILASTSSDYPTEKFFGDGLHRVTPAAVVATASAKK